MMIKTLQNQSPKFEQDVIVWFEIQDANHDS